MPNNCPFLYQTYPAAYLLVVIGVITIVYHVLQHAKRGTEMYPKTIIGMGVTTYALWMLAIILAPPQVRQCTSLTTMLLAIVGGFILIFVPVYESQNMEQFENIGFVLLRWLIVLTILAFGIYGVYMSFPIFIL